ncbi:MAG: addiction module protein [Verrucomicrobia bacterium]|nr:addiction module protein [Verrucomicrobiota bacterium]
MLENAQIEKMSIAERLQVMEQLWDALCRDAREIASPEWHRDVLADRKARAQTGEAKFLTLDQLRARLRGSES